MTENLKRRTFLMGGTSSLLMGVALSNPAAAQSHSSGGGSGKHRGGGRGGGRGRGGGTDKHGGSEEDHASGDDHTSGDDHGDDGDEHGDEGGGKGPKYRGGRETTEFRGNGGHSLVERVLKVPLPE